MKTNTEVLTTLEKPVGSMKILLHLHRHKQATITNLLRSEQLNQKSTYSALGRLQTEGLVTQLKTSGFPGYKFYQLTDKGKTVARRLTRIANLMVAEE